VLHWDEAKKGVEEQSFAKVTFGGPNVTFAKPIDTFFELSINSAPSPFGEQNFEHR
jgi:hypothetical protein